MCRSARDTLLTPVLDTSPLWWEPLILHTKQGKHSTNHTSERLQDTSIPWAPGGNVTGSTGTRGFERNLKRTLHLLFSTSAVGCPIPFRGLLTTASADVLILIPYEAQQGGLCLSPRKTMHVSVTVATPRSTPPPTPLPMVPSSDVCQCMLVHTPRESTPHCQNILGSEDL